MRACVRVDMTILLQLDQIRDGAGDDRPPGGSVSSEDAPDFNLLGRRSWSRRIRSVPHSRPHYREPDPVIRATNLQELSYCQKQTSNTTPSCMEGQRL
ncbi:hypothetical protein EYF80_025175 [Liparis tanakae]|uniref:Uncharacterized protein n=1 Tax=Liparis tanakae TaxID=230148 RepID=A0A4Z2HFA0_9TELE|nr:hypothetical protein EYF80_025175 [Liparis tanakae]